MRDAKNRVKCILFDLDGTLCDVEHRRKYVQIEPKNWEAFNAGCEIDKPNAHVLYVHNLIKDFGHKIIYCSGRSGEYFPQTLEWLKKIGVHDPDLRMRAEKDRRSDDIVKKEILDSIREDGFDPIFAVDDRDQVVRMWRENGVPCFQCAPGDF